MRIHVRVALFVLAACLYGAATSALADANLVQAGPKLEVVPKSVANGLYFAGGFTADWAFGSVTVILTGPIDNTSTTRTSGTLQLQLWAVTYQPTRAGAFTGYRLARSQNYSPLSPQTQYNSVSFTAPFNPPPNGTYWLVLSLAEYDTVACAGLADLFCVNEDSINSTTTSTFGVGQLLVPASISFTNQPVGTQSAPIIGTVTNIGGSPVTVSSVTSTDLTDFPSNTTCVTTIQPGGQCTITVSSAPSTAGFHSATVVIASDGFGSPQSFTVSGSGVAAPGQLQVPSSITFANQLVGTQSAATTVTITNIGGTPVTVSNVTGTDLTQFPGNTSCVTTIQPQGQCIITTSFAPTTAGPHSSTIVITSDGIGSPQSFTASGTGVTSSGTANAPGPLSGLWWNPNESGWGIVFTQRRDIVFAAWYTYDNIGNPKWYVAPNCGLPSGDTGASGTCTSALYQVSGPTYFGAAFNSSLVNVASVGSLTVDFQNANAATMSYTLNGQNRSVPIVRQVFQSGSTPPVVDYTDLWWNPNESGWGMEITHQYGVMFLAWYVYNNNGQPVWYVAPDCVVAGSGCTGTVYSTTGPPFGPSFNPATVQVFTAGTISVNFSDANNGTLTYTVNGVSATKTITRQLF